MKAFPTTTITPLNVGLDVKYEKYLGMDLRDYFAARVMPILIGFTEEFETVKFSSLEAVASVAYSYADAMMKQREVSNG